MHDQTITDIEISRLCYDRQRKNREKYSVVAVSVKLHGYDKQAPPIYVFPDPKLPEHFIVVDGNARVSGARLNGKVKSLPCVIVTAKSTNVARAQVAKNNAEVHEIRDRKTFGYYVIRTLRDSYTNRPLTKNLSIKNEEHLQLQKLSGESSTLCNRALGITRKIYRDFIKIHSELIGEDIEVALLTAMRLNFAPELADFYYGNISVRGYQKLYKLRTDITENNSSDSEENSESSSRRRAISAAAPAESAAPARQTASVADAASEPANVSAVDGTADQTIARPDGKTSPDREFLNVDTVLNCSVKSNEFSALLRDLSNLAAAGELGIYPAREKITSFLEGNPAHYDWIYMIAKCCPVEANRLSFIGAPNPPAAEPDQTGLPDDPIRSEPRGEIIKYVQLPMPDLNPAAENTNEEDRDSPAETSVLKGDHYYVAQRTDQRPAPASEPAGADVERSPAADGGNSSAGSINKLG